MTTAREANEQWKVIRSVMEKAVIFRALSGETALVGGAVALAMAWAFLIFGLFSLATVANIVELKPEWLMRVNASRLMAVPFGVFHLVYGGLIATTSRRGEAAA